MQNYSLAPSPLWNSLKQLSVHCSELDPWLWSLFSNDWKEKESYVLSKQEKVGPTVGVLCFISRIRFCLIEEIPCAVGTAGK